MEVKFIRMQAEYRENGRFKSHNLTSWPKISEMFPNNLPKMTKNENINWVMHPSSIGNVIVMSKKIGELLWPTPQPFTQNVELCIICCSPFGPKGAWTLGTCQHMYHPQCLITLMLARRKCSQCRAPFHLCLYKQFNLWTTMPHDALPSPKLGPRWALVSKTAKLWGLEGTLPALSTKRGRGACWSSEMGLGRGQALVTHLNLHQTTNNLVSSHSGTPLVLGQAAGNSGFTRLTTAQTRAKPPPSPI
jgi:hypothetical protein